MCPCDAYTSVMDTLIMFVCGSPFGLRESKEGTSYEIGSVPPQAEHLIPSSYRDLEISPFRLPFSTA